MVSKDFETDDLVWAKMKGFSFWPGRIAKPPPDKKANPKKAHHYVYFFGSENYAWILDENIVHHTESMLQSTPKKKSTALQNAIDVIAVESKSFVRKPKPAKKEEIKILSKILPKPKISTVAQKKLDAAKKFVRGSQNVIKKRPIKSKIKDDQAAKKKRKISSDSVDLEQGARVGVIRPFVDQHYVSIDHHPSTSRFDACAPKRKHVKPTDKKIGFLGLGMMGREIVRNLINSGHHVTVWNRTPEKCEDFIRAGALKGQTPADVVRSCDITFCCVSDPIAAKSLVFGCHGVLEGLDGCKGQKGYVEMTSLNDETSQEIAEAVNMKDGRYLEAPISGSRNHAEEGSLLILGSGDRALFNSCETCFHAMSMHAYYISCDIGKSSKINLVISMLSGTIYASIAESMALLERLKLPQKEFLEMMQSVGFSSRGIMEKGQLILDRNFAPNTPLKHVQKDLNLALMMSDTHDQTMYVTSAANELYKHAKLLGYAEHDVSAVYQGVRY